MCTLYNAVALIRLHVFAKIRVIQMKIIKENHAGRPRFIAVTPYKVIIVLLIEYVQEDRLYALSHNYAQDKTGNE